MQLSANNHIFAVMKRYSILDCRYYNGEEENPFAQELDAHEIDKSHLPPPECMKSEYTLPPEVVSFLMNATTAWRYEKWWVEEIQNEEQTSFFEDIVSEYSHFFRDFEADDGTPIELKALLWNRYEHWSSGSPESFKEWYHKYYQARLTNRQQRTSGSR